MAAVVGRENSGVGFFTYLAIDKAASRVASTDRVLGNVVAMIDGLRHPLLHRVHGGWSGASPRN